MAFLDLSKTHSLIYRIIGILTAAVIVSALAGCGAPRIKLFTDATDPLREYTLEGEGREKVAVISLDGIISDQPRYSLFFRQTPSMVQEVVSQLNIAKEDPDVKALVLKVNSPGGTTTASDILYNEIKKFKEKTGAKIVVSMMDVAASGGYYVSLSADHIMAHPTTVTGSVGVIFMRPEAYGLMDKIGVGISVSKSGKNKDMGSPFREITEEEEKLFEGLIADLGGRFTGLVEQHRPEAKTALEEIKTARIFVANDALRVGLIDEIGYVNDAVAHAKRIAGLRQDARVVVYHRLEYPDDNLYNTSTSQHQNSGVSLVNVDLLNSMPSFKTGFYYLWWPAAPGK